MAGLTIYIDDKDLKKAQKGYSWTDAQKTTPKDTKPQGKYNVVATDKTYLTTEQPKSFQEVVVYEPVYDKIAKAVFPAEPNNGIVRDANGNLLGEMPIEPLYGLKDPVFNLAFLGAGLANGAMKGITSIGEKVVTNKPLWTAISANNIKNRIEDEGVVEGVLGHPVQTTFDLLMLGPAAKGIKTVGNETMWKYTPELKAGIEMSRNVKNAKLNSNVELPAVTRFKLGDKEITPQSFKNIEQYISDYEKPLTYDSFGNLIPNKNFYFRRGWGIIDDANETGKIRVPDGDYKKIALQKYPWLDNGNPYSTSLINHKFPYFAEGVIWPQETKFGKLPEDLIAVPNNVPNVEWVAGSKFGILKETKLPSDFGGRATPITKGDINLLNVNDAVTYKLNPQTNKYEIVNQKYTFDPSYGYVKLPTTEMSSFTTLKDMQSQQNYLSKIEDLYKQHLQSGNISEAYLKSLNDEYVKTLTDNHFKKMYHYTQNGFDNFKQFEPQLLSEPMFHFGTENIVKFIDTKNKLLRSGIKMPVSIPDKNKFIISNLEPNINNNTTKEFYIRTFNPQKMNDKIYWDSRVFDDMPSDIKYEHEKLSRFNSNKGYINEEINDILKEYGQKELTKSELSNLDDKTYEKIQYFLRKKESDNIKKYFRSKGYDSVEYINKFEFPGEISLATPYNFNIKEATPIKLDAKGNIMLPSQRFDFKNPEYEHGGGLHPSIEEYKSGGIHINPKNEEQFQSDAELGYKRNGGVLDATYNEQIERIRQPRFVGWRMNGRRPIIKSRRKLLDRVNNSSVNFVERMKDANREKYWFDDNNYGTHLMSWATQDGRAVVYPKIQEKNGKLVYYKNDKDAIDNAIMNNDVLYMTPREARWFTENYKKYYPEFADGGIHIKEENRGKFTEYAKRHGKTVPQMEDEVLSNKDKYPTTIVRRAVFSRNARTKFNH